jgi:hypothetical protein
MAKKIYRLRVPAEPEEGYPEFVAHGQLEATLTPGGTVETDNANFAWFLEDRYDLEPLETVEVEDESTDDVDPVNNNDEPKMIDADAYPQDFPAREILIGHNVPYETAIGLDADQLKSYKGIGPKLADEIIEFVENGGAE